jgi:hypothetical protein
MTENDLYPARDPPNKERAPKGARSGMAINSRSGLGNQRDLS